MSARVWGDSLGVVPTSRATRYDAGMEIPVIGAHKCGPAKPSSAPVKSRTTIVDTTQINARAKHERSRKCIRRVPTTLSRNHQHCAAHVSNSEIYNSRIRSVLSARAELSYGLRPTVTPADAASGVARSGRSV